MYQNIIRMIINSLSILTAIFQVAWVSWYQNVSILDFIRAKNDGGGCDNWSYKTCNAPVKLSPPTNQLIHHHHSELVGDVAVPVSAHQVVLSCAFLNPDARPRLNGRRSASTVLSQVSRTIKLDDLGTTSSSWDCAICMLWEHRSDPGTCPPKLRGQTAWGVWHALTAKAVQCVYGFRSLLHAQTM